jgi:uncharacterized membrane protein YfcA
MGVLPQVVAATNQYIGTISALSVTIMFFMRNQLNIDYALFIGVLILVSSLVGLTLVNSVVKKTGRQSVIVFILAFVIFATFLLLPFKYALKK